jgi:hypothetical protein
MALPAISPLSLARLAVWLGTPDSVQSFAPDNLQSDMGRMALAVLL